MKKSKSPLKCLPLSDRPRERMLLNGPEALSNIELIAVILGSGTKDKSVLALSQEILARFGSLDGLFEADIEDLCQIKGLGKVKAVQLKGALTLASRIYREKTAENTNINSPLKAYLWVREYLIHEKKEIFGVILLDTQGGAIRWERVSTGILDRTLVHPREVFNPAIRYMAASLILVHNHPSGNTKPSEADRMLTKCLIAASESTGIPILDHIIVTKNGYASLKSEGLAFTKEENLPYFTPRSKGAASTDLAIAQSAFVRSSAWRGENVSFQTYSTTFK